MLQKHKSQIMVAQLPIKEKRKKMKAIDAINKLKKYEGKPRKVYPWLPTVWAQGHEYDCAAAVSWVLGITPEIVSCGDLVDYFKHKKQWFTSGVPVAGDLVIFDWETAAKNPKATMGHGTINHDHVGIVIKADKNGVWVVSADSTTPTPGLVSEYNHSISYRYILGYGRPGYAK